MFNLQLQLYNIYLCAFIIEKGQVFGVVGWVQEGGGILGDRGGCDCCSIEVVVLLLDCKPTFSLLS